MVQISIKVKNIDEVKKFLKSRPDETKKELGKVVKKTALLIKTEAKRKVPVDTGLLKTSIQAKTNNLESEVSANTRYAIYVHEGTRRMSGRPFMTNAVKKLIPKIKRLFEDAIKKVIKS